MGRTWRLTYSTMNDKQFVDSLAAELKELSIDERWRRVRDLPISTLVQLLGVKWRSVGDYAWDALRGHPEREKVHQMIIELLMRREFRHVDARVRALHFLTAEAARSEGAKAVYRMYLADRSSGVVSCAIPGSVWSLDDEALPVMEQILKATKNEYLLKKIPLAIKAIQERDPRMLEGGRLDPAAWGLSFPVMAERLSDLLIRLQSYRPWSADDWEKLLPKMEELIGSPLSRLDERDSMRRKVDGCRGQVARINRLKGGRSWNYVAGEFGQSKIWFTIETQRRPSRIENHTKVFIPAHAASSIGNGSTARIFDIARHSHPTGGEDCSGGLEIMGV